MKKMMHKQGWHLLSLVVLLFAIWYGWEFLPQAQAGVLWGVGTSFWFWLAIAVPVIHQIYAVIFWRGELHTNWLSKSLGSKERAFKFFRAGFFPMLAARPVSIILLSVANREQLSLGLGWRIGIGIILFAGFAWMMYSVVHYFGMDTAAGRDHFYPEEYKGLALEKRGIYRYVDNAMYSVGFFILWFWGVIFASPAALLAAAFNHAYIWVHWFTVEKPDMQAIYGGNS
ncbi:MAG: hypothetical protein HND51_01130 [Chloroflexi bacterium]|nr:hypothetical protein [Chloroflexota bacterium]